MLDEELRKKGPPETFDNTMLSSYHKCPRSLYWFLRRLVQNYTPIYFTSGRAWGAGLNVWHLKENQDKSREERLLLAGDKLREVWEKDFPLEKGNDTLGNLEKMLMFYTGLYGDEAWTQLAPEVGFKYPVPGTSIFYAGALDAYIEWKGYGILAREDKSTGSYITEPYLNQWSHASQITGYFWALWQTIGEEPFGILMNIASKRPRKDSNLRFSRDLQKRTSWRVNTFLKDTVILADKIRNEWKDWTWSKLGERDPYACAGGPGKTACPYRRLCLAEAEPWELEESYNFAEEFTWLEEPWAPWEREGEG